MYYTSNERMVEILEVTKKQLQENMKNPWKCNQDASYFACIIAENYCKTDQEVLDIYDYISQNLDEEYTFMSYLMKNDPVFADLRAKAYMHEFECHTNHLMIDALKYEMEKKYNWINDMIHDLQQP